MSEAKQRSNSAYIFSMRDGKMVWTYPGIGELTFDPDKASATNRARAMMYGWKQRINDTAALDADEATGKVSPQAKFDEMKRTIEHYETGTEEWALRASAAAGPASYVTQALVALREYQGHDVSTPELANAFVKRVAEAPKLKLKGEMAKARKWLETNSPMIRDKIAELRAAETPAINADEALEALLAADDAAE